MYTGKDITYYLMTNYDYRGNKLLSIYMYFVLQHNSPLLHAEKLFWEQEYKAVAPGHNSHLHFLANIFSQV